MVLNGFFGKKICVAISGGEDSVALLHYLKSQEKACGFHLLAVHCEHGIRGEESLEDMRFVQTFCSRLEVPLTVFEEDCPARAKREKESLETAARNFRHECFASVLSQGKADFIATAHHSGDEAETVLFRLARGSSLSGLKAMSEQDGRYLRPILTWSKEKIHRYIEENRLLYRVDSTNLLCEATRNKIRLEVLPRLEKAVDGATQNIAKFAALAAEDDALLYELSDDLIQEKRGVFTVRFSKKKPLFTRAALTVLKRLGLGKDYTSAHLLALFDLQGAERGARLHLPKKIQAEKGSAGIVFFNRHEERFETLPTAQPFSEKGFDGGRYAVNISKTPVFATGEMENVYPFGEDSAMEEEDGSSRLEGIGGWKILRLDGDKLPNNAYFRFRREGDSIRRFGGGKKSLKKFFNEEKIPPKERGYLPLIADDDGVVFAVCGVEIAEDVKVDENTKNTLYVALRKKEN